MSSAVNVTIVYHRSQHRAMRFFQRMIRRTGMALVLMATVAFAAAAAANERPVVIADDLVHIRDLDPGVTYVSFTAALLNNVYDRLLAPAVAEPGGAQRQVAASYDISADGLTYTFLIRGGLRFHSGNPLRAQDVAYTLHRTAKLGRAMARFLSELGVDAQNVDDCVQATSNSTLLLRLPRKLPQGLVLGILASPLTYVLDEKLVRQHEQNGDFGHAWLMHHSAGSGPYRVTRLDPREWVVLSANTSYAYEPPRVPRLIFRDVPEISMRRIMLQKGDADFATFLDTPQLQALAKDPAVSIHSQPTARLIYMVMNQANPALADARVREALNLAIDRETIASTLLKDAFFAHQGFWPRGLWASLEEPVFTPDLARARALLTAAGYRNGVDIDLDASTLTPYAEIAQAMQSMLARAGIRLHIAFSDDNQNLTKMQARRFRGLIMRSYRASYADPHDAAAWFVVNADNSDNGRNKNAAWRARYVNADLAALAEKALHETDSEQRRLQYLDMQRRLQRDGVIVVLFQQMQSIAARSDITGFGQGPFVDQSSYHHVSRLPTQATAQSAKP